MHMYPLYRKMVLFSFISFIQPKESNHQHTVLSDACFNWQDYPYCCESARLKILHSHSNRGNLANKCKINPANALFLLCFILLLEKQSVSQKTTLQLGNCLNASDLQNLSKVASFFLDSMSTTGVG